MNTALNKDGKKPFSFGGANNKKQASSALEVQKE